MRPSPLPGSRQRLAPLSPPHFLSRHVARISGAVTLAIGAALAAVAAPPPAPPPHPAAAVAAPSAPANPYETTAPLVSRGRIDDAVFARWHELGIVPAAPCSDAVFVRRVFLDLIATLPTPAETREFLADHTPDKRARLVERLFEREEFADTWTLKWSDLLRLKAEFPINLWPNAAQAYHHWIHTAVRDNLPYDRFARELLTASGSNFRVGPVNFYRALQSREPESIARTVALTFMGARAEKWSPQQLSSFAMCFRYVGYKTTGEWKEEIVFFDPNKLPAGGRAVAIFPDQTVASLDARRDPRQVFANWLITPQNPWFTRAIANRAWSWFFGRGIVHEPDDLRADNPPVNPALLRVLEEELIAAKYDLRQLFRSILASQTYQLSPVARCDSPAAEENFAFYAPRRLEAEVLIDALNQVTGTTERYSSAIPEPFTFIPEEQRSIALPDGSITSSFLEMFGKPGRDTGLESERNSRLTANQRLYLLNSTHVQRKIEQGRGLQPYLRGKPGARDSVDGLYLTVVSRWPTESERQLAAEYARTHGANRNAAIDLAWALINSTEFLYRH